MVFASITRNDRTVYSDILIRQGTTYSATITLKDDAGNAFNLTGFTVRGQLRLSIASTTNVAFVGVVTDATGGIITISLDSVVTAALDAPSKYFYDVEIFDAANPPIVHRVLEGRAEISPEITR